MGKKLEIEVEFLSLGYPNVAANIPILRELREDDKLADVERIANEVKFVLMSGADIIHVRNDIYKKIEDAAYSSNGKARRIFRYTKI